MDFRSLGFIVALALSLTLQFSAELVHAADNKPVAQVGTDHVTQYELAREQSSLIPFNVSFHSGVSKDKMAKIQQEALTSLLERAYKVNYALEKNLVVDKRDIDERIDSFRKKFKTEKEFKKALGEEGLKDFRESQKRDLLAQKAEDLAVTKKINITDSAVKSYYDSNRSTYKRPKQFKASHILIKIDPSANKEERLVLDNKATELAKRAKSGEDFFNLAYYNSDDRSKYVGGDLGYFHEGQTVPEFEEALNKLKPGEISNPVKSMFGWHIIKLVEVNEARQLEFDEVKDKIRTQLEKTQKEKLYSEWMDQLKAKYTVTKP